MLTVVRIGKWSELSACSVFHVVLPCKDVSTDVMSGEVARWCVVFGTLVGVFLFIVM